VPSEPYSSPGAVWKRFLLGSVVLVVLMMSATAAIAILEVKHVESYFSRPTLDQSALQQITPAQAGAPETILVIGSDKRRLSKAIQDRLSPPRSDTLMLIRMDPSKNQVSVLSIPRDLKATITPDNGPASAQKINAAYAIGGAALAAQTIKRVLPGIEINHVVDVNYAGFRQVIDAIGCVYVYVDRHYYNANTGTIADNYASINIKAGYQKLCGQTALDYVRYRHTDSDFIRVARQQDFIRQAERQINPLDLFNNQDKLLSGLQHAVQTDIHGSEVAHLIELTAFSFGRPLRQVHFQSTIGPSFVTATPYQIEQTVNDFLHGNAPSKVKAPPSAPRPRRGHHGHGAGAGAVPGLSATPTGDVDAATAAAVGFPFRLLVPRLQTTATPQLDYVRAYTLRDEQNRPHKAYVISVPEGLIGEFYGIEGTNWTNPPILDSPSETISSGGRTYQVVLEGAHFHVLAWHQGSAVYWINNTLSDSLGNRQMLALARSVRPVN
jgi:LCP family protein required for cell wall assembly